MHKESRFYKKGPGNVLKELTKEHITQHNELLYHNEIEKWKQYKYTSMLKAHNKLVMF